MAEDEAAGAAGDSLKGFVTRKIGPFPVWLYGVAFVGVWYFLQRRNASSSSAGAPGTGTDPAGNTGEINPATGYVYGSPEDTASLASQGGSGGGSGGSGGGSGSSGGTTYSDNNAWAEAAINYLVGLGDDATVANAAIEAYLSSQTLTQSQQAMVNSAITALGAPPQPPQPTTGTPIVAPPGGSTTYATNPPSGLATTSITSTSIGLKWNAASNATGYTITSKTGSAAAKSVTSTTPSATISGLTASTTYSISVQATPADAGAPSGTLSATTAKAVSTTPPPVTTPPKATTHTYIVVHGDTLSSIAAKNKTTLAVIKQLNPVYWTNPKYQDGNFIVAGDKVVLPGA